MIEEGERFGGGKAKVGSNAVEEDVASSSPAPGNAVGTKSAVVTTGMAMGIVDGLIT